jgi:hypothetical protein
MNTIRINRVDFARGLLATAVTAVALLLSACSDDAEAKPTDYVVDAVDFSYGQLPDSIVAGSSLGLTNSAPTELHELVAIRLPDTETRSLDEILATDPASLLAAGPPALVVLTPPGGEQIVAVGDGTLTEPGRYAIICMIPTGVDPAVYLEAAAQSNEGPPQVPGAGAPHVAHGMHAELTVTAP